MTDDTPTFVEPRTTAEQWLQGFNTMWSRPAYWLGALRTREALDDHTGAVRAEAIHDALLAGKALSEIPEFTQWLAYDPAATLRRQRRSNDAQN